MAQTLPPLPAGFEGGEDTTGAPPLPAGFEGGEHVKPAPLKVVRINTEAFTDELKKKLKAGATEQELNDYAASVGREIKPDTLKAALEQREARVQDQRPYNPVISTDEGAGPIGNFVIGGVRGVQHAVEGAAQLGLRSAGFVAPGIQPTIDNAQAEIADMAAERDANMIKGGAGRAGVFVGETIPTLALPVAEAGAVGRGLLALKAGGREALAAAPQLGKAVGTLAATGGVSGAMTGAERTGSEQDSKVLMGAALSVLGVPLVEKLVSKVGVPLARKFYDRYTAGVGKELFNPDGTLNQAGKVFRVRLKHASPGVDDEIIDAAMQQIRDTNPKRLPAAANVVPEMVAQKEGVPLIQGMKERNPKKMQDFASTATGARGLPSSQNRAVAIDDAIDNALTRNVNDVKGSDVPTAAAVDDLANTVGRAAKRSQDVKNAAYAPLNKSSERIVQPTLLLTAHDDFVNKVGETGFRTLRKVEPATAAYADELRQLGRKKVLPFGDLWSLSKRINGTVNDNKLTSGPLVELQKTVRNLIDTAPPEAFESGERGVFDQLKRANAANRDYKTRFSAQNRKGLSDTAGRRVEGLVAMFNDPTQYSAQKAEEMVFGGAKTKPLGGKDTEVTIRRLIKATPAAQQPLREIAVNRILDQMVDGVAKNAGDSAINPVKASKLLSDVVDKNSRTLKALGMTENDINRFRNNAYLAALKTPPQGARARGSSTTNRAVGNAFKGFLLKALTHGTPGALLVSEGAGAGMGATALAAAITAAAFAAKSSSKVTKAALSTKALPVELNRADKILLSSVNRATRATASQQSKGK